MRQQLRLGLGGLREARCQDLRNALVILLPGALEQRLIGRILDEGVLEHVGGLGRGAALVEELGLHELMQLALQGRLVEMRHGLEQLKAKLPPKDCAQLRNAFGREEPIEPGHERVLQRGGNRQGRQRTASAHSGPRASRTNPDSSTILVSSSTNSGTPSVLATICSTTAAGSVLPPVTRCTISSTWAGQTGER